MTGQLRLIGAGLPRTGTHSLRIALERLLGGRCYHMSVIPGHPFDLGPGWDEALTGGSPNWNALLDGFVAAVDWPASMFWRELSEANAGALIVLSTRASAKTWWESVEATILPVARMANAPDWNEGLGLVKLIERFAGTAQWDDPETQMAAYDRHNALVCATAPPERFLDWRPEEGWAPLCRALGAPIPDEPFPWVNRREDWG